ETGRPINGATITLADTSYTSDTWDSLFRFYSIDPEELANGFYYLDLLTPGSAQSYTVTATDFYPVQGDTVLSDTTFTFTDIRMVSSRPPQVVASTVADGSSGYVPGDPIRLTFSRPVD